MFFYILVVYFCTTLISQVFLLLQIFNTVTLRMPFTRNHYHGTGSAKHSSFSYMTRALRALVCNWMSSGFAKPILSTFSIKPAGLKLSVFWHYIDESSLKTPPGHKKPFTSACHADINHLHPHGLLNATIL